MADLAEPGDQHGGAAHLVHGVVAPAPLALVGLEARKPFCQGEDPEQRPFAERGGVDSGGARPRDPLDVLARQPGGGELLSGACIGRLHETEAGRGANEPRDLRRVLAWEAEHDLGAREQLGEPFLLRRRARERRIADMV